MEGNREAVIEEVRRRWRERDPEPFLPPFVDVARDAGEKKKKGVGR